MLVVFVAPKQTAESEFLAYLRATRLLLDFKEIEFAFLYPEDMGQDLGNLQKLMDSELYLARKFGVRVYRRGNLADYRDYTLADAEDVTSESIEQFVFRSTFVGTGPEIIR